MTRLIIFAFGVLVLFVAQGIITVILPQPFDHFPVFMAAGLLAFLSFRPIVGTALFSLQGLGIDLFSIVPGFTTVTAVLLAYITYLVLKQLVTHQSLYASFIITLSVGALWFLLVNGLALYTNVADMSYIFSEVIWGSVSLAIIVSVTQMLGPRVINRMNRVVRISS